jgi:hypothetical protein
MSLEQELARNTEAMIALTAALTAHAAPAPAEKVKSPKPVAVATPTSPAADPIATSTPTEPSSPSASIEYAQIAKAITDTFKVDRAKTIETLAMFGATKGPQLKPEDYARFLKVLAE